MLKVGVVNVNEKKGGRRTFVDDFCKALKREGYEVHLVDINEASLNTLNSFDVLHFSAHFLGKPMWKVLLATHPRKVLTIHGWVKKENLYILNQTSVQSGFRALCQMFLYSLLSSIFLKILFIVFDAVTCPSENTAKENGIKNVAVITNALFTECFSNVDTIDVRHTQNEILFVTYVSVGGLKNVTVDRTIRAVKKLNESLKHQKATLLVFGKDYLVRNSSPHVRFMGFSDKFLGILKSSDLFITGKVFPDIGYAEMQAGVLGIPVAKFTENCGDEEIVDGETGILAKSEDEMVGKLLHYISDLENSRRTLGSNFRKYIENEKSWNEVIVQWNKLFMKVCQSTRKEDT